MRWLRDLRFYDCELDGSVLKTLDGIQFRGEVNAEYCGGAQRELEYLKTNKAKLKYNVGTFDLIPGTQEEKRRRNGTNSAKFGRSVCEIIRAGSPDTNHVYRPIP